MHHKGIIFVWGSAYRACEFLLLFLKGCKPPLHHNTALFAMHFVLQSIVVLQKVRSITIVTKLSISSRMASHNLKLERINLVRTLQAKLK